MGTTAAPRGPQPDDTGTPARRPAGREERREPWRRTAAAAGLLAGGEPTPTVFEAMTALAAHHGAVNLGQGSPDEDGPGWVRERAAEAVRTGRDRANQYAPGLGLPVLREAVAAHQKRHYALEVDPGREVLVTTGATEGIAAALLGLVGPGDEVVAFEPFYDSYAAMTALAGARFTAVPLRPPHFLPDPQALEEVLGPDTRVVVLNTPHNPTGVVPDPSLLARLVEVCARHDVLILSDEVYEHLVYEGRHHPVAAVPGAWDRTLTVSSAGKSFSLTGWKVGWVTGPADLVAGVRAVKQFLTYSTGPAYQRAIAEALTEGDAYLAEQRDRFRGTRDLLLAGLREAGLEPVVPAAGYFTVTDLSALGLTDAAAAVGMLAERAGLVGVPVSALCTPPDAGGTGAGLGAWMRWAFCKPAATIEDAVRRFAALPSALAG